MGYRIERGIYQLIESGVMPVVIASALSLGDAMITGDSLHAFTALGLGMAAESLHYTATVGKAMTSVPDSKEGLESKVGGQ